MGITNGHGFFYHVQGLLHLLKQRGPSSFQTRLSMQIFHAIRYNSVWHQYFILRAVDYTLTLLADHRLPC